MLTYIALPVLTIATILCLGGAILTSMASRKRVVHARIHGAPGNWGDTEKPSFRASVFLPLFRWIGALVSTNKPSAKLRMQMDRAGFSGGNAVFVYLGAKVILFSAALVASILLVSFTGLPMSGRIILVAVGATFSSFLPNGVLRVRTQHRSDEIIQHLPDMVDLFEICVSGGMGVDSAWNSAEQEIRAVCPLLANEMAITTIEMHLGAERSAAIRHMAERTAATDLLALVAVLVQTQRFGTSLTEALRIFASTMRDLRNQRAEEAAAKMAIKMLFPMTLLIFPVVLIVAIGPASITLAKMLGQN